MLSIQMNYHTINNGNDVDSNHKIQYKVAEFADKWADLAFTPLSKDLYLKIILCNSPWPSLISFFFTF